MLGVAGGITHLPMTPEGIWKVASTELVATTFTALGFTKAGSLIAEKGLTGALASIPGVGWVLAVGTFFIPTPGFIKALFKPKFRGGFAIPFPEESLKILKHITGQNAEYLFMMTDFKQKDKGLLVLRRLLKLAEKPDLKIATNFQPNKFLECCRLSGYTSLYDKLVNIDNTIQIFRNKFYASNMPFDITFDDMPIYLTDEQKDKIVIVGSKRYNALFEKILGRKVTDEPPPILWDVIQSRKIDPATGLPTYTDLLYQKPYYPPVAYETYGVKIVVVCPTCNGKGYIIRTKSGFMGIHPKVTMSTCPTCQGYGYILVG